MNDVGVNEDYRSEIDLFIVDVKVDMSKRPNKRFTFYCDIEAMQAMTEEFKKKGVDISRLDFRDSSTTPKYVEKSEETRKKYMKKAKELKARR